MPQGRYWHNRNAASSAAIISSVCAAVRLIRRHAWSACRRGCERRLRSCSIEKRVLVADGNGAGAPSASWGVFFALRDWQTAIFQSIPPASVFTVRSICGLHEAQRVRQPLSCGWFCAILLTNVAQYGQ